MKRHLDGAISSMRLGCSCTRRLTVVTGVMREEQGKVGHWESCLIILFWMIEYHIGHDCIWIGVQLGVRLVVSYRAVCICMQFLHFDLGRNHTHTLYLSEFSGPVEGILMICVCFILTGIFGRELWSIKLLELDLSSIGYSDNYVLDSSSIIVVLGLGSLYFNIIVGHG